VEKTAPSTTGDRVLGTRKIDVDASIRQRARTVASSELARRHKKVQVLGVATIRALIQEAVGEAVQHLETALGEEEKRLLLEEAEEEFKERLGAFQAEKAGLEAHTASLQDQLARAQKLLEEERDRIVTADQFTVSDAGIVELEKRFGRMLDRAIDRGGVGNALEHEMREVVAKLLDDEREHIRARAEEAQNDRIELLERKVGRLAGTLEDTQKERDRANRRAHALESAGVGGPLRNVFSGGIEEDDPDREKKLHLMKEIFKFNQNMRAELTAHGAMLPQRSRPEPVGGAEKEERAENRVVAQAVAADVGPESEASSDESDPPTATAAEPPPPEVAAESSADAIEESEEVPEEMEAESEPAAHPDDLPWEPAEENAADVTIMSTDGAARVTVANKEPPPLLRRVSTEQLITRHLELSGG